MRGGGEVGMPQKIMRTHCAVIWPDHFKLGRTKFTTSGAHDVIAITSPQKNDLCTEELRDRAQLAKSLDQVSLPLRNTRFGCLLFR